MWRACWLTIWVWLAATGLGRAGSRFTIDVWGTEEGLPQSSVIAITQTSDGYLWLGTMNGLVRFNGVQFTVYNESNTPELKSSPIVRLFEDSEKGLWIGTENAGVFRAREGRVTRIDPGTGTRDSRLSGITEDPAGAVWYYTANGQLARYRDGRVYLGQIAADYASNCRALALGSNGLLWIGTDWRLYALQPPATASSTNFPKLVYEAAVPRLDGLLASRDGGQWRLVNGRVQKWNLDRLQQDVGPYPWSRFTTPVNALAEDGSGNLVIGTGGEGVFWSNPAGGFEHLSTTNGLSHDTILSLCFDREGSLWVGTDGGGLDRVKAQIFDVVEETRELVVRSISPDDEGGLWIGYNKERIDHWNERTLKQFGPEQGLLDLKVRSVFQDASSNVWAGTLGRGLLSLQNNLFLPAQGTESLARDKEISSIYEDRAGTLWFGTQRGLISHQGETWKQWTRKDGLSANVVRAIVGDRKGDLWIGTEGGGLNRLTDGHFTVFNRTNGLPSDNITALCVDHEGWLWVGTSSGLALLTEEQCVSFENRLGPPGAAIGYVLEDEQDQLWIGSNAGLMRVPRALLKAAASGMEGSIQVRTYAKADGLPTRECTVGAQPAACRTADGRLWFSTVRGVAFVNPATLRQNTNPPPVVIESVMLGGQLQGTNVLKASPPVSVTVPAGREGLEFDFATLNLTAPEKGRFRYRLEGYDHWMELPATVRSVSYNKLPPGKYRFQVTAANEDGVWNPVPAVVAVTVLPPFWRTWWFLTLVSLWLLGTVVTIVHYISTQRLQRQLAVLRQHEALEKERGRIARDLHDQLGANLTQVALLGELAEADKDLPEEVEGHARQICNTARETTRALDEIVWTVNPSNDTLEGLVNYICKYAQEYLALAGLKYRLEVPSDVPPLPVPPELRHNVFLAAKEAVNNVVKHSRAGSAWLRLRVGAQEFTFEIEDDGRGIAAADLDKGRNGLRNMRRRMEEVAGKFEARARADGGTCIRLTAPISREPARN